MKEIPYIGFTKPRLVQVNYYHQWHQHTTGDPLD